MVKPESFGKILLHKVLSKDGRRTVRDGVVLGGGLAIGKIALETAATPPIEAIQERAQTALEFHTSQMTLPDGQKGPLPAETNLTTYTNVIASKVPTETFTNFKAILANLHDTTHSLTEEEHGAFSRLGGDFFGIAFGTETQTLPEIAEGVQVLRNAKIIDTKGVIDITAEELVTTKGNGLTRVMGGITKFHRAATRTHEQTPLEGHSDYGKQILGQVGKLALPYSDIFDKLGGAYEGAIKSTRAELVKEFQQIEDDAENLDATVNDIAIIKRRLGISDLKPGELVLAGIVHAGISPSRSQEIAKLTANLSRFDQQLTQSSTGSRR